jgi:ubiquinone/menaquinone biosynthesis C-methylase UbiE
MRKVMGGGDSRAGLDTANKRFGLGKTTPREMVSLLEGLERGEIVSREASAEMIAILKRQQYRDGIGRTLVGVEIANKTGALDRLRSDVAIVYSERGRIAMAITVDDLPEVAWNTENPGLLLLSRLSLALLEGLGAAPDRALLEKRLATARELDARAEADHAETLFRVAHLNALLGHREEACAALETLSQAALFDVGRIRRDEAFSALREDERFKKAVRAIWLRGYLWLLERPERDAYQKPDEVMTALAFRPGERVADIGAGSGYFARRVSKAVGPAGVVWAIDIAPEVLEVLEARARREGLANLRIQRVEADDPRLPEGGVDTILMVDTLHYVKDRVAYAKKLRKGLAPGGRVVVIDFVPKTLEERPWGPPPSQKMSREEVDAAMAEAGFEPARVHDLLTEQFFVEYRSK